MLNVIIILVFILSVAAAASSILIASGLRVSCRHEALSTLVYYLTFYFTFGFYAFWGQVVFITYISPYVDEELLTRATNTLLILGSPFVLFTWLMLVKFAGELSGRTLKGIFVLWFFIANIVFTALPGFLISRYLEIDSFTIIKFWYVSLNLLYALSGVILLMQKKNNRRSALRRKDLKILSAGILLSVLLHNALLAFYRDNMYMALAFIFVFFIAGSFIPIYIKYRADLAGLSVIGENQYTVDALCKKFEISPREREIISEICNGLTNQQIADKLFISLQTVKDHTSRIYFKINCSSRAQLITMVKTNN